MKDKDLFLYFLSKRWISRALVLPFIYTLKSKNLKYLISAFLATFSSKTSPDPFWKST